MEINSVWAKGKPVPFFDPAIWRQDSFGSLMKRSDYGDCSSIYGWEIDHVQPMSLLGSDTLDNKQPLNWKNNRSKSDKGLSVTTAPMVSPSRLAMLLALSESFGRK